MIKVAKRKYFLFLFLFVNFYFLKKSTQKNQSIDTFCGSGLINVEEKKVIFNPNCDHDIKKKKKKKKTKMTKKKLTVLLLYFNDDNHLSHQLNSWQEYSSKVLSEIQFLIVDDGSIKGKWAESFFRRNNLKYKSLDIRLVKIDQSIEWNIGGARNLGFFEAESDWVLMIDGDTIVKPRLIEFALTNTKNPNDVYIFFDRIRPDGKTSKPHPAVMLLRKENYWQNGGCDEDFVGNYGYTDPHFRYRLEHNSSLKIIKMSKLMKKESIPSLMELSKDIPCHKSFLCSDISSSLQPSRNTAHNSALFEKKKQTKKWSYEILRFTWKEVLL